MIKFFHVTTTVAHDNMTEFVKVADSFKGCVIRLLIP